MSSILRIMRTSCEASKICCFLAVRVSITRWTFMSAKRTVKPINEMKRNVKGQWTWNINWYPIFTKLSWWQNTVLPPHVKVSPRTHFYLCELKFQNPLCWYHHQLLRGSAHIIPVDRPPQFSLCFDECLSNLPLSISHCCAPPPTPKYFYFTCIVHSQNPTVSRV